MRQLPEEAIMILKCYVLQKHVQQLCIPP